MAQRREHWAGLALAEDIGEAIKEGLRAYPEGVEVGDIIYALFYQLSEYGSKHGLTVAEIGLAWNEAQRGRIN